MTLKIGLLVPANFHTLQLAKVLNGIKEWHALFTSYYQVFKKVKSVEFLRNLKQHSTIELFSILNPFSFVKAFKKLSKRSDILIIASLHPLAMAYLTLLPHTCPMIYISFGSDWKGSSIKRILIRYMLLTFSKIFVEFSLVKKQIHKLYNVPPSKFKKVIIWPIKALFNPSNCNTKTVSISELKSRLRITRKWVIFSPRALISLYNHHIITQSLSLLPPEIISNVEIVLIDYGTPTPRYKESIKRLADQLNAKYNYISRPNIWGSS